MEAFYRNGLLFIIAILPTWEKGRLCAHVLWMCNTSSIGVIDYDDVHLLPPCWLTMLLMTSQLLDHRDIESNASRGQQRNINQSSKRVGKYQKNQGAQIVITRFCRLTRSLATCSKAEAYRQCRISSLPERGAAFAPGMHGVLCTVQP